MDPLLTPRRILVLSDLWVPFPGGAERLIFNIARHLEQRGHHVHALTGYEHAQRFDGPRVTVNLDMPLDAEGADQVAAFIRGFQPEVIVTHHVYARAFGALLERTGLPLVEVVLNGQRMPHAKAAIYISEYVRSQQEHVGPDDFVLTPPAMPDVVADTHGDAIGFIKPLPHKGAEFFYRIARAMPKRRFVVLRGEWQDLEIIEDVPNVTFIDPVDDIRDFWKLVRVVLVPSLSEDAGTVGQEAALNGVPCISSPVGGLRETNAGGLLLATTRTKWWRSAINTLDNPTTYAKVVENQRAHLERTDHQARLDRLARLVEAL